MQEKKEEWKVLHPKKFISVFKQKICQIVQHTENYEDAIIYSTKEKRIAMNGNDCYVFDITKLKKYLNIDTAEFIED